MDPAGDPVNRLAGLDQLAGLLLGRLARIRESRERGFVFVELLDRCFIRDRENHLGRDQVILAIADEATIQQLDKYKSTLAALTDSRKTTEEQARELIKTGKPIYWITSGIHSPETGGPEMLIELAYRLIVEETPFIQSIRNNVITFITPVVEVDGREAQVDTYYFNKKLPLGAHRLPLMYWGKYVQHDNNRDGMGQYLKLTQNITK